MPRSISFTPGILVIACILTKQLGVKEIFIPLINRDKRGRKGSIIAVVQGTKADDIIAVLTKMPKELP